jgi:hypothetical protein
MQIFDLVVRLKVPLPSHMSHECTLANDILARNSLRWKGVCCHAGSKSIREDIDFWVEWCCDHADMLLFKFPLVRLACLDIEVYRPYSDTSAACSPNTYELPCKLLIVCSPGVKPHLVETIEATETYQEADVEAVVILDLAVVSVRNSPPGFLFRDSRPFVLRVLFCPDELRCPQASERSRS